MILLAMIPENPVVGGTVLRRAAIQSPNFVHGSTGWTINQDGSVEFNSGTFRGFIVGGGLFIYNGAPGPGNFPVFSVVPPGTTQDPFGNAVAAVVIAGQVTSSFTQIDANGDVIIHDPTGSEVISLNPSKSAIFIYNSPAQFGNLASSDLPVNASAGTDSFGNAFLPGKTTYKEITATDWQATQLTSGGLSWWTATSAGGPWSLVFRIGLQPDEIGLSLSSTVTNNGVVIGEAADALEVTGGISTDTEIVNSVLTNASPLQIVGGVQNASPLIKAQVPVPVAQQIFFGGIVSGDANSRLVLDVSATGNPRIRLGSGAAAPDVVLTRLAANLLSLTSADLDIASTGRGLQVAEGANARQGVATLVGGTQTVNNTTITANTRVFLSRQNLNGTPGHLSVNRVVGTSFTINSSTNLDTSQIAWLLTEPG